MVSQPGRVDWALEAMEDGSLKTSELSATGAMSDATPGPFMGIVKNWLNESPPSNRLAFGSVLEMRTVDERTGCEKIQPYLHSIKMNPQGISDFFYQINRPRESTVRSGIRINRLSRWSVSLLGTIGVTIDPAVPKATTSLQGQYACRLELDINTAPLSDAISRDDAHKVFQELVAFGKEIANKGDVA